MKRIFQVGLMTVIFTVGCLPSDAYKQKYPQQEISFGVSAPYSFSESEKIATENQKPIPTNSETVAAKTISPKRRPITETMKFIGEEERDVLNVVKRRQE